MIVVSGSNFFELKASVVVLNPHNSNMICTCVSWRRHVGQRTVLSHEMQISLVLQVDVNERWQTMRTLVAAQLLDDVARKGAMWIEDIKEELQDQQGPSTLLSVVDDLFSGDPTERGDALSDSIGHSISPLDSPLDDDARSDVGSDSCSAYSVSGSYAASYAEHDDVHSNSEFDDNSVVFVGGSCLAGRLQDLGHIQRKRCAVAAEFRRMQEPVHIKRSRCADAAEGRRT